MRVIIGSERMHALACAKAAHRTAQAKTQAARVAVERAVKAEDEAATQVKAAWARIDEETGG